MKEQKDKRIEKFAQDEEVQVFKLLLNKLKKKYHVSSTDILNQSQEEILIPCTIFTKKLSPLETDVKYLRENVGMEYAKIAELLGRNRKTIWQTYKNAVEKLPGMIVPIETEYNVPAEVLKSKLSALEAAVVYLKEEYKLSYHKIGELLHRNERTIWTVYRRALKKK